MSQDFTTVREGYLSIITNDFDSRPMSFVQGGERQGYEPALANAVCERLGLTPLWFNVPTVEFYQALSSGEYDVIWYNQAITQERRAWADFTRPYGRFDEAVLVKEDSDIHDVRDLQGKRLGGLAQSTSMALKEHLPDAEWVVFPGNAEVLPELIQALHQHKIDALVYDAFLLLTTEADNADLRVAFQLATQQPFGVGVLPGNRELLDALNEALTHLVIDGTMARLWAKWIPYKPFPFS